MTLTPQWLDELRARVTLSGVISRTVRLTKAGHEFKACCPFHNEKSPSFTVNDQKGFYHCFGCGAHGDVIRWMTDQQGLSFMDAVKELAAEAGMEVPAPDPRAAQKAEQQAGLHEVMEAAQAFYRAQLETPDGARARDYLASRRFDPHTMERFGFGYAPAGRQVLKAALKQFDEAMLVEAGLRIAVDDDQGNRREPYDRFRDRLTMPIHDARGRVIGFAARILDAEKKDAPKYLNSPDTPLFDKGRTLFNLHRAGPASRQTGRIVVVEGQMDVIALAAAGIEEAVAPMGTALTERQLEMLWRLVETPILCFDGDAAGQRAAMRAITRALPLLRPAHSLKIVRMPTGMDPDDLIKRDGVAALEALLANPKSLLDQLWEHERDAVPLTGPEDKAGLKARLMSHVDTIADRDIQSLYRRDLLAKFSAFAFPPRDWTSQGDNVVSLDSVRRWRSAQKRSHLETVGPLRFLGPVSATLKEKHSDRQKREAHLHRRLGAAVSATLLRFPEFLAFYAETLLQTPDLHPRIGAMIEASFEFEALDTSRLETILIASGHSLPNDDEWDRMRFPIQFPPYDDATALRFLENSIRLYAGRTQVKAELKRANQRFEREQNDFNFYEQQRLRKLSMDIESELGQMRAA